MSRAALAGALVLLAAGCGGPPDDGMTLVRGTVTLDGKPLRGGRVDFVGEGATATQVVSDAGVFQITALPPGEYKVAVVTKMARKVKGKSVEFHRDEKGGIVMEPANPAAVVPKKYASAASSGLTATVKPGGPPIELTLTSK